MLLDLVGGSEIPEGGKFYKRRRFFTLRSKEDIGSSALLVMIENRIPVGLKLENEKKKSVMLTNMPLKMQRWCHHISALVVFLYVFSVIQLKSFFFSQIIV